MALTAAQLQTLSDDIAANTDQTVIDALAAGNHNALRDWYNQDASPDYWIYKNLVSLEDVGFQINGQNLADITAANSERLANFFTVNPGGAIPSRSDHRAFFNDVFSGAAGTETLANLDALWSRLASNAEELFATGAGSSASPSIPSVEGAVSRNDITAAVQLIP